MKASYLFVRGFFYTPTVRYDLVPRVWQVF